MGQQGKNTLATVGFNSSQWISSLQYTSSLTEEVSRSTTAASNGMAITVDSGFSAPGWADPSTLGHVANGAWTDSISKYGTTTFNFSDSIDGFGGNFNITGGNGLYIEGVGEVPYAEYTGPLYLGSAYPSYHGFIGFVLNQPSDSLLISWGDNGSCAQCFANSYTLSGLEVGTLATPEPNFGYVLAGMVILITGFWIYRSQKTTITSPHNAETPTSEMRD